MLRCLTIASLLAGYAHSDCKVEDDAVDESTCLDLVYDVCQRTKGCGWGGPVPERLGQLYLSADGKTAYDAIPDPPLNIVFWKRKMFPWQLVKSGLGTKWSSYFQNAFFTHLKGDFYDAQWLSGDTEYGKKPGDLEDVVLAFDKGVVTDMYSLGYVAHFGNTYRWNRAKAQQKVGEENMNDFDNYIEGGAAKQQKEEEDARFANFIHTDSNFIQSMESQTFSTKNNDPKKFKVPKEDYPVQERQKHGTCALFSLKHLVHDTGPKNKFNAKSMEWVLKDLLRKEGPNVDWRRGINIEKGSGARHCYCSWDKKKGLEGFNHEIINHAMSFVGAAEEEIASFKISADFEAELKAYTEDPKFLGLRFSYSEMFHMPEFWVNRKLQQEGWQKTRGHSTAFVWHRGHWWYQNSNDKKPKFIKNEKQLLLLIMSKKHKPSKEWLYKVYLTGDHFVDLPIPRPSGGGLSTAKYSLFNAFDQFDVYDDDAYGGYDVAHKRHNDLHGVLSFDDDPNRNEEQTYLLMAVDFIILILFCFFFLWVAVGCVGVLFAVYKFVLPKMNRY